MQNNCSAYGALLERGRVLSVSEDGAAVESLERGNVTSPPLAFPESLALAPGDTVYFCLFDDGDGLILEKAR